MKNISWRNYLQRASQSWQRDRHPTKDKRQPLRSRRLELERLEDRTLPSVTVGSTYTGLDSARVGGGSEPPDTQGAAGPASVIETVNQGIGIFTPKSTGTSAVTDTLSNFLFTTGGLPHVPVAAGDSDQQADPFVIYDPLVQRFIVGDLDFEVDSKGNPVNGGGNALLLAVSTSNNPTTLTTSDWFFYSITTTESGVALQDYPGNPGYNADALVVTLNSYDSSNKPVHSQVNAISMNALITGTPLTLNSTYFQTDNNEFLMRPTPMPDSTPGGPMWLVAENGTNTSLDVIRMGNVLSSSPTFTISTLGVNPYSQPVVPSDPSGKIDSSPDARILQTGEQNGLIVATHEISNTAGNENLAAWYEFNISSGTPVLVQQGAVGSGANTYDDYPGIGINSQGDIALTYIQSGKAAGMFESMYVTGRRATDAPGTMEAPVLIQSGTSAYTGTAAGPRQGDMSRIAVDPDGTFWAFSQFANNETSPNWGTAIAHFTLAPPVTALPFSATEGQLANVAVATFINLSGDPLTSFTATIAWGDGTFSNGQITTNSVGVPTVLGSHTYTEEGQYTVTVTVNSTTKILGSSSAVITVADAPLQGFAQAINTQVGAFLSNALVAVFTDTDATNIPGDPQGNPADYTATITWFENNGLSFTSTGRIQPLFGNTFAVYGDNPFSFPAGGLFTVQVVIHDVGGASVTVDSVLSVAHNQAIPPLVPQFAGDTGPVTSPFVTMEDALTNLLFAEQLFLEAVAFGTPEQQQHGFSNLLNAFFAYETAVFNFDMSLPGSTPS